MTSVLGCTCDVAVNRLVAENCNAHCGCCSTNSPAPPPALPSAPPPPTPPPPAVPPPSPPPTAFCDTVCDNNYECGLCLKAVNGVVGPHSLFGDCMAKFDQWGSASGYVAGCDPLKRTLNIGDRCEGGGSNEPSYGRACGTNNDIDNCRNWPLSSGEVYGVDTCDSTTGGCSDVYEVVECHPRPPPSPPPSPPTTSPQTPPPPPLLPPSPLPSPPPPPPSPPHPSPPPPLSPPPTPPSPPPRVCGPAECDNKCGCGVCLKLIESSSTSRRCEDIQSYYGSYTNYSRHCYPELQPAIAVAGGICEGGGECGTDNYADNW